MSSKEYLALSNFMRNTQQLNRDDLKVIVREVIVDVVKEEIGRYILTGSFKNEVGKSLDWHLKGQGIKDQVAQELIKRITIGVKP